MKNFLLGIVSGWILHTWGPDIVKSALTAWEAADSRIASK